MSSFEESFGRYDIATILPSGDQRAPLSEMSGVWVRLMTSAPSLETANRSYNSPPPKSCSNTIHFPSGDQTAPVWRSSDCSSWMGKPPTTGTLHRLNRPVRLVVKTISLPSGDQA